MDFHHPSLISSTKVSSPKNMLIQWDKCNIYEIALAVQSSIGHRCFYCRSSLQCLFLPAVIHWREQGKALLQLIWFSQYTKIPRLINYKCSRLFIQKVWTESNEQAYRLVPAPVQCTTTSFWHFFVSVNWYVSHSLINQSRYAWKM